MTITPTLLTSAAVAAGVSSVVTLFVGILDRRARRQEMIFRAALEMAKRRTDVAMQVARETHKPLQLQDDITLAEMYYAEMKSLFRRGRLTPHARKRRQESIDRLRARQISPDED